MTLEQVKEMFGLEEVRSSPDIIELIGLIADEGYPVIETYRNQHWGLVVVDAGDGMSAKASTAVGALQNLYHKILKEKNEEDIQVA